MCCRVQSISVCTHYVIDVHLQAVQMISINTDYDCLTEHEISISVTFCGCSFHICCHHISMCSVRVCGSRWPVGGFWQKICDFLCSVLTRAEASVKASSFKPPKTTSIVNPWMAKGRVTSTSCSKFHISLTSVGVNIGTFIALNQLIYTVIRGMTNCALGVCQLP